MQVIFKELTKSFEETLLESLIKNEKKEEFEKIRKNLINQASKEEFGDYQCNVCLVLSKIYKRNPREIAIAVAVVMSLAHSGSVFGPTLTGYMQESLGNLQLSMRIVSLSPITLVIAAFLLGQGGGNRSR